MLFTCKYTFYMSKMIQIRNVPNELHRKLKARAAMAGLSLSDYLLREAERAAAQPTLEELRSRLPRRTDFNPSKSPAAMIREDREDY
jgi:plasmid stability protein